MKYQLFHVGFILTNCSSWCPTALKERHRSHRSAFLGSKRHKHRANMLTKPAGATQLCIKQKLSPSGSGCCMVSQAWDTLTMCTCGRFAEGTRRQRISATCWGSLKQMLATFHMSGNIRTSGQTMAGCLRYRTWHKELKNRQCTLHSTFSRKLLSFRHNFRSSSLTVAFSSLGDLVRAGKQNLNGTKQFKAWSSFDPPANTNQFNPSYKIAQTTPAPLQIWGRQHKWTIQGKVEFKPESQLKPCQTRKR